MRSLFIGRFQPLHHGHLDALEQVEGELIIAIGSSQYYGTDKNPFTFSLRKKMLQSQGYDEIYSVPDIHDEKRWVDHVRSMVPDFDVVYTGNPWVKRLFEEKGFEVRDIKIRKKVSGSEIRSMIREGKEDWKDMIPEEVRNLIQT